MHYTVYRITNKINGKFYIGMHKTNNLNDGYMGSGKRIKSAINKHGIENFSKEILDVFDNEEDMKNREKELVILNEMSYNLCEGGKGGWSYVNKNGLGLSYSNSELAKKNASLGAQKFSRLIAEDEDFRNQFVQKIKDTHASTKEGYIHSWSGKTHKEETKQKLRGHTRQSGEKNSNYGKPRSEETKQKIRETLLKRKTQISGS